VPSASQNFTTVLCKISLAADGKAPAKIPLFPAPEFGGRIKARDGRVFSMLDAPGFVASYNADAQEAPLDYEHASEILAPMGEQAPAAGWIASLELGENNSVWGNVEWTSRGRQSVEAREYRYVSPAFRLDPETAEVLQLVSAGLTNRPALTMPALTRVQQETEVMDKDLLALLGLDEKATKEQVIEATKALKAAKEAAAVKDQELAQARTQLAAAQAQPSLDKFVPRSDYDATLARVATLEQERDAGKAAAHKAQVDAEIASALKAGKITPATKDFYVAHCSTAEGLESFRGFVKNAATIAPDNVVEGQPPAAAGQTASEEAIAIAARCGISRDQYLATLKAA
jgi:phage I-like protein